MAETTNATPRMRQVARAVLVLALLVTFVFAFKWIKASGLLERALEWIGNLGPWGPLMFIVIYVVIVLVLMPAAILTLGGGFVYGMWWGSLYVLLGATIAGNLCFILGRYFARDWVARKVQSHPKFKAIDDAVAREGWKIVALVRLAPVFPFSITSYAFGLTRIPLRHYFLANFAMIPGTLMYVYFGTLLGDLTHRVQRPLWVKWVVGAITLVVVFYITRFARRVLSQKLS